MFDFAAQNLIALGMKKLGKAVAEVTLDDYNSKIHIPLAFLDSIFAAELIIRGRILEVEQRENIDDLPKIELLIKVISLLSWQQESIAKLFNSQRLWKPIPSII